MMPRFVADDAESANFTKLLAIADTDIDRLGTAPRNAQDER
jgi:hypothetical protein